MKTHELYEQQKDISDQLDLLREQLHERVYPGYPQQGDRLVAASPADLVQGADASLVLSDGPWNVRVDTGRSDAATLPTSTQQQELAERGFPLDVKGRPLHPWFLRMVADPLIGVVLDKGAYWYWGDNHTADAAVIKRDRALLVQRSDTGEWALPGGFVEIGERVLMAARREVAEETALEIPDGVPVLPFYQGLVVDPRMTAHAWPETAAFLFRLDDDGPLPKVRGGDDAQVAEWVPIAEIQESGIALFGAHRFLLNRVIDRLRAIDADEPQPLDLSEPVWTELLRAAPVYANVYGKTGTVRMRPAIPGEHIATILADGTREVDNTATAHQMVITNPGGEEYIIDESKAHKRYEPTGAPGIFRAKGMVRAFTNPTGYPIVIKMLNGRLQSLGPDCKIAALFDPDESGVVDEDRYLIGAAEFATYAKAEEPQS